MCVYGRSFVRSLGKVSVPVGKIPRLVSGHFFPDGYRKEKDPLAK